METEDFSVIKEVAAMQITLAVWFHVLFYLICK